MLIKFGYIIQQRQERERERERRSERVRNEASPAIGESRESHHVNSISPCFYFASTISLWCNLDGFLFFFSLEGGIFIEVEVRKWILCRNNFRISKFPLEEFNV